MYILQQKLSSTAHTPKLTEPVLSFLNPHVDIGLIIRFNRDIINVLPNLIALIRGDLYCHVSLKGRSANVATLRSK